MKQVSLIGSIVRQVFVFIALVGLTFAAGIDWADAATKTMDPGVPSAVHVVLLFVATIGFVVHMLSRPQQRRVRVRSRNRRRTRY